jgi:outer membrane protein OmpA-like peptidoglycan-associated protein
MSVFFFWGDAEFAGETAQGLMDNIARQARVRRPSKIEITSHYMHGSEFDKKSESKRLAKARASNVRAALIERGVSSKILKVKSPVQRCVTRDDFAKQRRVDMVFIPEKKRK